MVGTHAAVSNTAKRQAMHRQVNDGIIHTATPKGQESGPKGWKGSALSYISAS
jgi:hypothetical protein